MAKIIFTLDEAISILIANNILPEQITNVRANGENISFRVDTGLPLLSSVPASIKYVDFKYGIAKLEMSLPLQRITNKLIQFFSEKIPKEIKFENPNILVDINKIIKKKSKGINVENIIYENESFVIITCGS